MVTDTARPPARPPQTHPQTHRQDRLQYATPLVSAQCNQDLTRHSRQNLEANSGHADHRFDQHIDHCICFLYDMYVADENAQFLRGSVLMPGVVFLILKLYQTALASLYTYHHHRNFYCAHNNKKTGRRRITNKNEVIK